MRAHDLAWRAVIVSIEASENIPAEVLVLHDVGELLGDVRAVHFHILFLQVRRIERNFIQHFFENRMQAARADVFRLLVDGDGKARERRDGVLGEIQLHAFGVEQRDVLLDERVLRLGEDAHEIGFA